MGVPYYIQYVEENVEPKRKHNIKGPPNILVDGELVFRGMPAMSDLRAYFKKKA